MLSQAKHSYVSIKRYYEIYHKSIPCWKLTGMHLLMGSAKSLCEIFPLIWREVQLNQLIYLQVYWWRGFKNLLTLFFPVFPFDPPENIAKVRTYVLKSQSLGIASFSIKSRRDRFIEKWCANTISAQNNEFFH